MAWYRDANKVKLAKEGPAHWTATYTPGQSVPLSGIYECIRCEKEVTCNKDDPFPPQNKHQHGPNCKNVTWQLRVRTETD
jgi:hypothetical protein